MGSSNPDPVIAWNVILTVGVLLSLGVNVVALVRAGKIQRREVSLTPNLVSREHCETQHRHVIERVVQCEADIRVIRTEIHNMASTLDETDEQRSSRIHARIDNVRQELAQQIQALPAQIIATLKNTGALD